MLSHHVVFGVAPLANCFQRPLEHFLLDSLENIRLPILKRIANCFKRPLPLLFVHRHHLDWPVTPNSLKIFYHSSGCVLPKLSGLAFARIVGFSFAIGEPSFEVASWPLFDMAFCFPTWSLERKSQIWLQENIEKLIMLNTGRRWFRIHLECIHPFMLLMEKYCCMDMLSNEM